MSERAVQANAEIPERLRILGVFAHPDDETFCAGGTLAKYVAAGAEAKVISFTRGDAGQIRDADLATRRTLGQVREQELRQACTLLWVKSVECLDYDDGRLKDDNRSELVGRVVEAIRSFRPDIVLTFGEDGAYGHPDHVAISQVTTEAFGMSGDLAEFPEQIASGLPPHAPTKLFHSQFPHNRMLLMDRLVRWLVGQETHFHGSTDFVQGLALFAGESVTMGFSSDHIQVAWYPPRFYIIEQGEPETNLYLILSGWADVVQEEADGSLNKVAERGPGDFIGEIGFAHHQPRNANVISRDSVTCLVLSPGEPTAFAGRGAGARFAFSAEEDINDGPSEAGATCIDVSDYVTQKFAAIAAHRTQYRLPLDLFPDEILKEMLGKEYIIRVFPSIDLASEL